MHASLPHVVIVGGGITGLSAAHALDKSSDRLRYTLIERDARLGGKVRTDIVEGQGRYVIEAGPDSFLTQKPAALGLVRDLGLAERLIGSNQQQKTVYIYSRGRLEQMPEGLMLVVPLKLGPFIRSGLLSLPGRLRAGLDFILPRRRDPGDESLGDFIRRRMGREVLERMAEPLMSGIHNAECERQSIQATFPRFQQAERNHGSLIRGLRAEQKAMRAKRKPGAPAVPAFASFPNGLQELIDRLSASIQGSVLRDTGVASIQKVHNGYRVLLENGETLDADAVIMATPAYVTAQIVRGFAPDLAAQLERIRYVSTGTVTLAFRSSDLAHVKPCAGVLLPRIEGRKINAVTMSSIKWEGRASGDTTLLRVFFGGSHNPATFALEDPQLMETVRAELRELLGITAEPLHTHIVRWHRANPQYDVGHLDRVAQIEKASPQGLYLAGCAYRGVGIPDCVQQGQDAAKRALGRIAQLVASN